MQGKFLFLIVEEGTFNFFHGDFSPATPEELNGLFAYGAYETAQGSRYLVKDFGTSKSPKSTRQRAKYFGRDCPASGTLR